MYERAWPLAGRRSWSTGRCPRGVPTIEHCCVVVTVAHTVQLTWCVIEQLSPMQIRIINCLCCMLAHAQLPPRGLSDITHRAQEQVISMCIVQLLTVLGACCSTMISTSHRWLHQAQSLPHRCSAPDTLPASASSAAALSGIAPAPHHPRYPPPTLHQQSSPRA